MVAGCEGCERSASSSHSFSDVPPSLCPSDVSLLFAFLLPAQAAREHVTSTGVCVYEQIHLFRARERPGDVGVTASTRGGTCKCMHVYTHVHSYTSVCVDLHGV